MAESMRSGEIETGVEHTVPVTEGEGWDIPSRDGPLLKRDRKETLQKKENGPLREQLPRRWDGA